MQAPMMASRFAARTAATAIRPSAAIWRSGVPAAMTAVSPFHTATAARASDKSMKITDPFERSEKLGRPMSPHLSIYAWQLTNTMSIMNRATGVAMGLVFYDYFASYALMPGMMAASSVVPFAAGLPAILFVGKAGLAFSFWYHLFGGIRHWIWDLGYMLDIKGVYSTGYAAAAATGLMTIATLALL